MNKAKFEELVKEALMLETKSRTAFLNDVKDEEVKNKLAFILKDDTESTGFIINTSAGNKNFHLNNVSDFNSGDKLKQFTIIKLIAKGGMGCVYLAYDEKLKRNVALKTIRSEFLNSISSQKRFQYEAQILSKINHPSICQIYDYIDYEDGDLLVLELVNGNTLQNLQFSKEQLLDIFVQIASALVAAHDEGIIHRDLKPDNIMVNDKGKVKILDFGIAKSKLGKGEILSNSKIDDEHHEQDNLTKAGSLMGTLIYMSPEQAAIEEVSKASDIYSFAIIIHEMLTGNLAYDISDTEDLLQQVIKAKLVISGDLPKEYHSIVNKMTNIQPSCRPNAKELLEELLKIKEIPVKRKQVKKYSIIILVITLLSSLTLYQWVNHQRKISETDFRNLISEEINTLAETKEKIFTLPLHDITNDIYNLKQKKDLLLNKITSSKLLNDSEKFHQTGKVYYATKEYIQALPWLEKSWHSGNQSIELAKDLAYANSLVYYYKGYKVADEILTDENNEKLKQKYFFPALKYLDKSGSTSRMDINIPNAILLWQDDNYNAAIEMLDEIIMHENWLFDAYLIKADILTHIAWQLYGQGKIEESKKSFETAELVYEKTIKRARSYPLAYRGLCILKQNYLVTVAQKIGKYNHDDYDNALNSCKKRLVVEPHDKSAYLYLTELNHAYALLLLEQGQEVENYLTQAQQWIQIAIDDNPNYVAYSSFGHITKLLAINNYNKGLNPIEEINKSIDAYQKSISLDNTYQLFSLGQIIIARILQLQYEYENNIENPQTMEQITDYFLQTNKLQIETVYQVDLNNLLISAYLIQIEYLIEKNRDVLEIMNKTFALINQTIDLSNEDSEVFANFAELLYLEAKLYKKTSLKQKELLSKALENINKALNIYDKSEEYLKIKKIILEGLK